MDGGSLHRQRMRYVHDINLLGLARNLTSIRSLILAKILIRVDLQRKLTCILANVVDRGFSGLLIIRDVTVN